MLEIKPFDKKHDKVEDWLEKLSKLLHENFWMELLLSGRLVPKGEKNTYLTGMTVDGPVVINEAGADVDLRVESDTDQSILFVDGGTSRVAIGNSAPDTKLHVEYTTTTDYADGTMIKVENPDGSSFAGFQATAEGYSARLLVNGQSSAVGGYTRTGLLDCYWPMIYGTTGASTHYHYFVVNGHLGAVIRNDGIEIT
jgi:hypothetical protein